MAYKQLKDWFDKELAGSMSSKIRRVYLPFPSELFINSVEEQISDLQLKARVEVFADQLYTCLGKDYQNGLSVLLKILGPENENETGMFKQYYWIMPLAKYVEKYGLDDFSNSIKAIEEITRRNTGEYAIRPFIEQDPERSLRVMARWSKSDNMHVRRLSCEGLRPRLPWAKKLDMFVEDPGPIIPILSNLKDDRSRYVQKSVANCLNDILKDNPDAGKTIIEGWNTKDIGIERKWIIRHALRNLTKTNDPWARAILSTD